MKPTNSSGNFLSQFETNSHVSIMQTQTTQTSFESHSIEMVDQDKSHATVSNAEILHSSIGQCLHVYDRPS